MRTAPLALLFLSACGRFGFGAVGGDTDAMSGDGRAADGGDDAEGADAPAAACLPTDILCETFDGPLVGWTFVGGTEVDPNVVHRGAGALRVHAQPVPANTNGYYGLTRSGFIPPSASTLYLRAWARLTSLPLDNMELIAIVQPGGNEDGVFVIPNAYSIYSQFEEKSRDTGVLPALDTWTCLLFTLVRGAPGSLRLAGDVGPVQIGSVITEGNPPLDEIDVGIGFSAVTTAADQPAIDVWLDDLLVRATPVTCAD